MRGRLFWRVVFSYAGVAVTVAGAVYALSRGGGVAPLGWLLLGVSGLIGTLGVRYVAHVLEAIDRVTRFAQAMEEGRATPRLGLELYEETELLASALGRAADRLESTLRNLSRDRATLEAVFESQPDPVIAVDARMKLIFMNGPAKALFGRRIHEGDGLGGRPAMEVLRDHEVVSLLTDAIALGESVGGTLDLDAEAERIYQATATPIEDEAGRIGGAVCVLHDQTALRRLERIRSDFVANVSHELRTPLTAIHGFIETLQNGSYKDPERVSRYLQIMHGETSRLIALITDLLQLSRLEAPESVLTIEPIDIPELAKSVVELFRRPADAKGLSLAVDTEADLPEVRGDGALIRQALLNLVDNSVKYTEPHGSIRVHVGRDDVGVRVTVSDTGVGIPADSLERVFERFYRVDKARSRKEGGTGLGLSIVRHTVESHKGRLDIASTPGKGTSIWFSLPAT